ncbi:hypothetical protein [Microbacterium maritypicum]
MSVPAPAVFGITLALAMSGGGAVAQVQPRAETFQVRTVAGGLSKPASLPLAIKPTLVTLSTPPVSSAKVNDSGEVRLMSQLSALRALEAGALGPGSKPILTSVIGDLSKLGFLEEGVNAVPMFGGDVALEWRRGAVEYTAEIRSGHQVFLCADNTATDELEESVVESDESAMHQFIAAGVWPS